MWVHLQILGMRGEVKTGLAISNHLWKPCTVDSYTRDKCKSWVVCSL